MATRTRTPRGGQFERDTASARTDAEAAELRAMGKSYRQIAAAMNCSVSNAYLRVSRAIAAVPVEAVTELRATECARIDAVIARLWQIADADHPLISHGKQFHDVSDTGPVIAALNGILKAGAEKRKLLGLDAPTRSTVTVVTQDAVDAELAALERELAGNDPVSRT